MEPMMALRAHARGGPEQLVFESAPRPVPGPGEVLVAVHAAGITFTELDWDATWTREGRSRTPIIPSHEFSGVVAAVGAGVAGVHERDQVYGLVPFDCNGAAAEFVVVPETSLAAKPVSVSHTVAAALPLSGLTAWQALVDHAEVKPGDRVLVQGGAGGVGAFAVQLALSLGADVAATARGHDVEFVRGLGAHKVIDTELERFDAAPGVYDVVLDTIGGDTLERSFGALRRGGRLVTLNGPPPADRLREHGIEGFFFIVSATRRKLEDLAAKVDADELVATIDRVYPLAHGREAYESGSNRDRGPGKTVLQVR